MDQQTTEFMVRIEGELAAQRESLRSAHKRIDENDNTTNGIHRLAANMETLAMQVKMLTERIDDGFKSQGERIGTLEKEPGQKWKTLVAQVIGIVVTAAVTGFIVKLT